MGATLGKVIKEARDKRQIDRLDFVEKVGVDDSTISKIENDRQPPQPKTLKKIAHTLNMPKDVIVGLALDFELDTIQNLTPERREDIERSYEALRMYLKAAVGLI